MTISHRSNMRSTKNLSQDPRSQADSGKPDIRASKKSLAAGSAHHNQNLLTASTLFSEARYASFDRNTTTSESQMSLQSPRSTNSISGAETQFDLPEGVPPPLPEKLRFAPSSKDLELLDLAVTEKPLIVPALWIPWLHTSAYLGELFRFAHMISPNLVLDEYGAEHGIKDLLNGGAYGSIRYLDRKDRIVNQRYVVKDILLDRDYMNGHFYHYLDHVEPNDQLSGPYKTFTLRTSTLEQIKLEIMAMLCAESELSPHAVLITSKSALILLPPMKGDAFQLTTFLNRYRKNDSNIDIRTAKQIENSIDKEAITHKRLAEAVATGLLDAAAKSLSKLLENGLAHRDVKPENFVFDQYGKLYLSDYGMATEHYDDSYRGTLEFMPFELQITDPSKRSLFYAPAGDIWAVGASAMEVLIGTSPMREVKAATNGFANNKQFQFIMIEHYNAFKNLHDLMSKITHSKEKLSFFESQEGITKPYANMFSDLLKKFPRHYEMITRCLSPSPFQRPTASQLKQLLENKATGNNKNVLYSVINSNEFSQTSTKDLKITETHTILNEAADQVVFRQKFSDWKDNLVDKKDSVRLSILEYNTKTYFEPGPFPEIKNFIKQSAMSKDELHKPEDER